MPIGEAVEGTTGDVWTSYRTRERILLAAGCIASYWIFSAIGRLFSIPRFMGYEGSLMAQPSAIFALLVAGVVLLGCVVLTSLFAGLVEFEGGLFCATFGLVALSTHSGPMRYVMMYSPGNGIFFRLIFEAIVLFFFVAVGWYALMVLRGRELLRPERHIDGAHDTIPAQGFMALAATVVIMIILMALLAQSDKKAQVIWAVGISSFLAALAAHSVFPTRPSAWYWAAPLVVAVIGYALAWSGWNHLPGGVVGGYAAPLGRPLLLDYASVGVAGALFGYWTSRRWQIAEHDPETPDEVEEALEHPVPAP